MTTNVCVNCKEDKGKRMYRAGIAGSELTVIECFDCYRERKPELERMAQESIQMLSANAPWMTDGLKRNREIMIARDKEFEEWMESVEKEELNKNV